jgi:hypothetical protein
VRTRRLLDTVPLTLLGALVAVAGWLAARFGAGPERDLVLWVIGWACVALVALAMALVLAGALLVWRALRRAPPLQPRSLQVGQEVATGFTLPALAWLPLVTLELTWLEPAEVACRLEQRSSGAHERIVHRARGEHRRVERRVVVRDVLGLARLGLRHACAESETVLPAVARALPLHLQATPMTGDLFTDASAPAAGDLVEVRRYQQGDPLKRILWKRYARSRQLLVRMPERATTPAHKTLAYLVAHDDDEPAAALARFAVESGRLGARYRFGADGASSEAESAGEALGLIVGSRAARAAGAQQLGAFLERARDLGGNPCVLFLPPRPGPWLDEVVRQLARHRLRATAVIGVARLAEPARGQAQWAQWAARLTLRPPANHASVVARREIDAVVERLTRQGARVSVVASGP